MHNHRGWAYLMLGEDNKYGLALKDFATGVNLAKEALKTAKGQDEENAKLLLAESLIGKQRVEVALKEFTSAVKTAEEIERLGKVSLPDETLAVVWQQKAVALRELGELNQGLKAVNKAVVLNKDSVHSYVTRGIIYHRMGDEEKAELDLNKAKTLNPAPHILKQIEDALGEISIKKSQAPQAKEIGEKTLQEEGKDDTTKISNPEIKQADTKKRSTEKLEGVSKPTEGESKTAASLKPAGKGYSASRFEVTDAEKALYKYTTGRWSGENRGDNTLGDGVRKALSDQKTRGADVSGASMWGNNGLVEKIARQLNLKDADRINANTAYTIDLGSLGLKSEKQQTTAQPTEQVKQQAEQQEKKESVAEKSPIEKQPEVKKDTQVSEPQVVKQRLRILWLRKKTARSLLKSLL